MFNQRWFVASLCFMCWIIISSHIQTRVLALPNEDINNSWLKTMDDGESGLLFHSAGKKEDVRRLKRTTYDADGNEIDEKEFSMKKDLEQTTSESTSQPNTTAQNKEEEPQCWNYCMENIDYYQNQNATDQAN